jgi:hypothetical protein
MRRPHNLEPIQEAIARSRSLMREAGWAETYAHNFLMSEGQLRTRNWKAIRFTFQKNWSLYD